MRAIKYVLITLLLGLIFTACAPSEAAIQTAMAQTQAALPTATYTPEPTETPLPTLTPTITPIPLSEIDLESLVFAEGDFPPFYERSVAKTSPPQKHPFTEMPLPVKVLWQETINTQGSSLGNTLGEVGIFLYDDLELANQAYSVVTGFGDFFGETAQSLDGLGEQALFDEKEFFLFGSLFQNIAFTHCGAFIYANIPSKDGVNYATRLDARLSEIICP